MPAAAVIPAPKAYIKIVAVKKLVVGYLVSDSVLDSQIFWKFSHCWIYHIVSPLRVCTWFGKRITLKK